MTKLNKVTLNKIFLRLNHEYFNGNIKAQIIWGRKRDKRKYSIQLGRYDPKSKEIRLHPILAEDFVPFYYIEYVVYHEMLHADIGIKKKNKKRWEYHSTEFKKREKEFLYYSEAAKWEKENLNFLLNKIPKSP